MNGMVRLGLCLLASAALNATAAAATIEEVQKALIEAHGKLKSYSANFVAKQDMSMQGMTMKGDFRGSHEYVRKGDKTFIRTEMKGKSFQEFGVDSNGDGAVSDDEKQKQEMDVATLMVCDGEALYTLSDQQGQKSCYKVKADPASTGDVKAMFDSWKDRNPKLVSDEKVDGADCFVIETDAAGMPQPGMGKARFCFRKDCGVMVRVVMLDDKGKIVMENATMDLKLNPDIDASRFVFKAPEGVEVVEMPATP